MDKNITLTIVVIYMILLLPPMIQTQRLSNRFINKNIRNNTFLYMADNKLSKSKFNNRCLLSNRPRAVFKNFKLCYKYYFFI